MPDSDTGICLLGGGGHARSVRDLLDSINTYSISLGGKPRIATVIGDTRELTPMRWSVLCRQYSRFLLGVGHIKWETVREAIVDEVVSRGGCFITLISPHATVSQNSCIGTGTTVGHRAVVNTGAGVGQYCILNTGCIIEHDAYVGSYTHVSTGAIVNGGARVGHHCFIGSHSVVLNQVTIADHVVLGAGSVAVSSIEKPGLYLGNPAGFIKEKP